LCRWEDQAIPAKALKIPSLAELVNDSELEDRIAKHDLSALLQARLHQKGAARWRKSPSRAPPPSQAAGASKPGPPSTGSSDPQTKIEAGGKVSPRTELREEIAKQMAVLEEKHLQVQLEKVVPEREMLRRDRLGCASSRGLDGSRERLDRPASRESSVVLMEEVSREQSRGRGVGSEQTSVRAVS
jgi:hypothetical protein